jgi:uncharacterized membrane protein (UPF0127 family)
MTLPPHRVARSARARLIGLAWRCEPPAQGLLLPRTRSVHTFGMRFPLDLYWLDEAGRTIRRDEAVPPRRIRTCMRARAVLEVPATAVPSPNA